MRQVILDTETTGLEPRQGHKIIEIGCIEMVNRRMTGNTFHHYVHPEREIDEAAIEVHGITLEKLEGKPLFADLAEELLAFLRDSELIIHNAPFDVAFLNHEFKLAGYADGVIETHCEVLDSLVMARHKHPGQKNSLDALCRRYEVDNSQRELHGALLDAEILADVYLAMTGGQISLIGESEDITQSGRDNGGISDIDGSQPLVRTPFISATAAELEAHEKWLTLLEQEAPGRVVWNQSDDLVH